MQAERLARTPEAILPEHLVEFSGRYQELGRLTTRDLFDQVIGNLTEMTDFKSYFSKLSDLILLTSSKDD